MTQLRHIRWLALCLVLILGGLTYFTGTPIPLWHFEELNNPVAVTSATANALILEDGVEVTLPFISEIPYDSPLFKAAITEGVEINEDGAALGLMWLDRNCGLDPVVWRKVRVNLSDLAGALHPSGIDESIVHPEAIEHLAVYKRIDYEPSSRSHKKNHLTLWDRSNMQAVRRQFEFSATLANPTPLDNAALTPRH
ncbi:hypothetical protein [Fuerstiella marisgermanici]|uniref:Uncharacterized protein n=1 Tax=Fuerstiella marisgermanici TaxID=1891926 RepID=A0A1P8WH01_9PLAN|nr:hypothetical protein [Fuerstiella marisgermanici]APZ93344.1 hypothetical protein Fuma_02961 [Fuerstiella marisgermanici]